MTLDTKAAHELRRLYAQAGKTQDAANLARNEFHDALTAAHANATLRELATALGISHQRVHQLVTRTQPTGAPACSQH